MRIYKLSELPESEYENAGGKAKGLNKLIKAGLEVADGFVIIGLSTESDYAEATKYYEAFGGSVAVRSSATAEDGEDFSAAGQYLSLLDVSGADDFTDALKKCVGSLNSETAETYSAFFSDAKSISMSVVVQRMVNAACAGVVFTSNPVTGEKNILIEAVEGLGEALVSGHSRSESCIVPLLERGGKFVLSENVDPAEGKILSSREAKKIAAAAVAARDAFGQELDLEWAVSGESVIWLQARPITTQGGHGIDELDCRDFTADTVFTTCNIGEMLPGAVTPLSLSTSVASIDYGLRRMLVTAGAYKNMKKIPPQSCIVSFSNHLFFNLTTIYKMAVSIVGAAKQDVEASICGKRLDTPKLPWKMLNVFVRLKNAIKYFRFILSRNKAKKKINKTLDKLKIEYSPDAAEYYANIDKSLCLLDEATLYHYITSAHSGAMSSMLLTILTRGGMPEEEARARLAGLLEDIDGIESVDILRSMRALAREIIAKKPDAAEMDEDRLARFIKADSGAVRAAYSAFMARHGHRAIREAELRSKSWETDQQNFMENLLTVIRSGAQECVKPDSCLEQSIAGVLEGRKGILKALIKYVIKQSRQGVYNREYTKARFVRAVDVFKKAYARLAADLVSQGALPEKDLIYFLSHKEIGELIHARKSKYIKLALKRRRLLSEQAEVRYKDVYIGKPEPLAAAVDVECANGSVLSGTPISRGEVKGYARVVRSVGDAKLLKKGEIMVAAFTDIGWSPYYSLIGGLITEVGSALSHGAVVAREYALPLVVNINNATNLIKTGDYINLSGTTGKITILETAADAATA